MEDENRKEPFSNQDSLQILLIVLGVIVVCLCLAWAFSPSGIVAAFNENGVPLIPKQGYKFNSNEINWSKVNKTMNFSKYLSKK